MLPVIQTAMTPVTARETILLVEDDDSIQHADCWRRNPSPQQLQLHKGPCHLLVTDVIMPRMKRTVLVEGVKAMRPEARTLYMSGYAGETLEASEIHEDAPFLQKPFLPTTLIEKVQEILQNTTLR